ncbi:hypothetical protein GCM10009425_39310 [Pseudomonas asuensis]|jgi:hypothetical protein|uniref:PasA protein n=1 Tax=Pseudomonas asuensis TaxID=1825787 RepID=A0ABQ2H2M8_9PSED|nr:DUF6586 family protein [Pseudomonas asuensis]GGM24605.1 hypothetical protein GCM10009425_39310 [Pseudomonas asuensis]
MSHEIYTRTNQKLYFAGLSLESWRKAEQEQSINAQGQIQAEREATLFHLYGAVLGLCHEVAGYYRMPNAQAVSVDQFLNPETLKDSPSPELAELLELASYKETWLAQLLAEFSLLQKPPQPSKQAKVDPSLPLIESISLNEEKMPLGHAELEVWRKNIKELALRFRGALMEW